MNTNKISNISSDYIIKNIFSYLEYNNILEIIKYNKLLLNKLNIKKEYKNNYILKSKSEDEFQNKDKHYYDSKRLIEDFCVIFGFLFDCLSIFIELGSIIFISKEIYGFLSFFCFTIYCFANLKFIFFFFFIIIFVIHFYKDIYICFKYYIFIIINISHKLLLYKICLPNIEKYESQQKLIIKVIFLLLSYFIELLFNCYIGIIIWYDFSSKLIIIGYVLIFSVTYYLTINFFIDYINLIIDKGKKYYLIEYNGIKIENYLLPNYKGEKIKDKFLREICKSFIIKHSNEELELMKKINTYRRKKDIDRLLIDNSFPDFLINKKSEMILFPYKKIYKLSTDKYLCKLKDEKFFNDFEIKNILLKDYLNKINVVQQNNIYYILVFTD